MLGAGRAGVQLAEYGAGADRERAALQAGYYNKVLVMHKLEDNKILKQIWYL